MSSLIVERTRLALAVGLHQKASEVWNQRVDLLGLGFPPCFHLCVQRISRLDGLAAIESLGWDGHRRGKVHRQIDPDTIGSQDVGNLFYLVDIGCRQHLWRGVDIIENGAVDAYRSVGTGVFLN